MVKMNKNLENVRISKTKINVAKEDQKMESKKEWET